MLHNKKIITPFGMMPFLFVLLLGISFTGLGQNLALMRKDLNVLAGNSFGGRGYVGNSRDKAAKFLVRRFKEIGLKPFPAAPQYEQEYGFKVNTFPNRIELKIGKKVLVPGADFLVDAASAGFQSASAQKMKRINLNQIKDTAQWLALCARFKPNEIYQLNHLDTFCKRLNISVHNLVTQLPRACYLLPQSNKLIWTVAQDTIAATVIYIADTSLPRGRKVTSCVQNKLLSHALSKNIVGYIEGSVFPDSFFVFTAHYDHLGKMGNKAVFPGANDNASGTVFNLEMARYFVAHPPKYSIVFIAFSGEELGLLGSKYFVEHTVFPLENIKLLVNIDLMSDATDGITIVNAVAEKKSFDLLNELNDQRQYLSHINSRDNAHNSDHYYFTQAQVPAIFIYANGGPGYYHDIWDTPKTITFHKIPEVFQLLTELIDTKSSEY